MLRDESFETGATWGDDKNAIDWKEVDHNLRKLAARRGALDAEEARWLRQAVRGEIWRRLGKASLLEYLEDRLGARRSRCSNRNAGCGSMTIS